MSNIKFSLSRISFKQVIAVLLISLMTSSCSEESDDNQQSVWDFKDTLPLTDTSPLNQPPTDSSNDGTDNNAAGTIGGNGEPPKTNTPAVISGIDSGSVTEDVNTNANNMLEFSGKLEITDADGGEAAFKQATVNSNYGSLTIDTLGNWTYLAGNSQSIIQSLGAGSNLVDRITVSSIDGTTHNIVINIKGSNDKAIISGISNGRVTEDVDPDADNKLEVSGKLEVSDRDIGEAAFVSATRIGKYGNLTINQNGTWNYSADNRQEVIQNLTSTSSLNELLTVSSIDGTDHNVVITIFGADESPVINTPAVISGVDSGIVTEDSDLTADGFLVASGTLTIEDPDPGEEGFIAEFKSGTYGRIIIDMQGNWSYLVDNSLSAIQSLASGQSLTDSMTISSIDGTSRDITVSIQGVDDTASTLTLSWVAPVEREDLTPISPAEISGYRIYYGTSKGQYPNSVDINDGSATSNTFTDLADGVYYFVITTYDTEGRESKFSTEVEVML